MSKEATAETKANTENPQNAEEQALATAPQQDTSIGVRGASVPTMNGIPITAEILEIIKETQNLDAQLETLEYESLTPTFLAEQGIIFNVIDCVETEIPDDRDGVKMVVIFKVADVETGEIHVVMQSSNSIRSMYARKFANYKLLNSLGKTPLPMFENMQFVYDERYKNAGNTAIVLKKAPINVTPSR